MRPTKPYRTCDALEFAPQPVPRLALALESVPAREERRLHSFLLFGALGLPQCSRGAEQIGEQIEGSEHLVGHA